MAEYLADTHSPRQAVLLYSNRAQEEIAYRDELDAIARANKRFRVVHTLTREPEGSAWQGRRGRIDGALLAEAANGLAEPRYFLCGLPEMVRDGVHALDALGIPRERMVYEILPGYQ